MTRIDSMASEKAAPAEKQAANGNSGDARKPPRPDTSAFDIEALARAVLARQIRPRVGEIRRLAEAVIRQKERKRAKKALKGDQQREPEAQQDTRVQD